AIEAPTGHRTRHGDCTGVVMPCLHHHNVGEVGLDGYFLDADSPSAAGAVAGTAGLTPAQCLLALRGHAAVAVPHAQVDGICDPGDRDRKVARRIPAVAQVSAGSEAPAQNRAIAFEGTGEVLTCLHR